VRNLHTSGRQPPQTLLRTSPFTHHPCIVGFRLGSSHQQKCHKMLQIFSPPPPLSFTIRIERARSQLYGVDDCRPIFTRRITWFRALSMVTKQENNGYLTAYAAPLPSDPWPVTSGSWNTLERTVQKASYRTREKSLFYKVHCLCCCLYLSTR
jgi:hypothetical protein